VIPDGSTADVILDFGGGRYRFYLPLKAEVEVERLCGNVPLGVIYDEFASSVGIDKATETPVYMDGGQAELDGEVVDVSSIDATRLVEQHVEGKKFSEVIPTAWMILKATLSGIDLKKKDEAAASTDASNAASS
jgi:hypothetical protein